MATIQNINVSTPNDNLGDTLRGAMVISNDNFLELNDKKVEKISGKNLSSNDYSTIEQTKLAGIEEQAQKNIQSNWNQTDDTADDYIIGKPTDGTILAYGAYTLIGNVLTIEAGWVWRISNVIYSNSSSVIINIPYCSAGLLRLDLVVFNTSNTAVRVEGIEVSSAPVSPIITDSTVLFAIAEVSDSDVFIKITETIDLAGKQDKLIEGTNITIVGNVISSTGGTVASDLSLTANPTNNVVTNSNGTGFTIPLANGTNAGLLKPTKFTLLEATQEAFTTALKTAYDSAVSSVTSLLATGSRLITTVEITKLSNTTGVNTGDQYAIARTGSVITFDAPATYNSPASPSSSNLLDDLTGARIGIIQPIYINKAVEPTYPAGWVKIGIGNFTPSVLNMICCEWVGGTRVNYWIVKA